MPKISNQININGKQLTSWVISMEWCSIIILQLHSNSPPKRELFTLFPAI